MKTVKVCPRCLRDWRNVKQEGCGESICPTPVKLTEEQLAELLRSLEGLELRKE